MRACERRQHPRYHGARSRNWSKVFELSERFTTLRDRGAAITWAREANGLSKKLLSPSVIDAVVESQPQAHHELKGPAQVRVIQA